MFGKSIENNQQQYQINGICDNITLSQVNENQNQYFDEYFQFEEIKDNLTMDSENSLNNNEFFESYISNDKNQKTKRITKHWTAEEDEQLKINYKKYNGKWNQISKVMKLRNKSQCAQRWRRQNPGNNRKQFTQEEDNLILQKIQEIGKNWTRISYNLEGRTGKQIRDRYVNVLDTSINKSSWSEQEDQIIIEKYQQIGAKWSEISTYLSGRPENCVKNRYYSYLSKQYFPLQNNTQELQVKQQQISQSSSQMVSSIQESIYFEDDSQQFQQNETNDQLSSTITSQSIQENTLKNQSFTQKIPTSQEAQCSENNFEQKYEAIFSPNNFLILQNSHSKQLSFNFENASLSAINENYQLTLAFQQQRQDSSVQFDISIGQNQKNIQEQIKQINLNNIEDLQVSLDIKQELERKLNQINQIILKQ